MNQNRPQMPPAIKPVHAGAPSQAALDRRKSLIKNIRKLIWLYFFLLIFEGALRKWIVPQFSNPLLIVRDPVVVAIYVLCISAGLFPRNRFVFSVGVIALLSWITGVLVLLPFLPPELVLLITGYGLRSNFLHLPLIFVIPAVFDLNDVKRIGWWTMVGAIPTAVLMGMQFRASPESFINHAAGLGEGQQIGAGGGKIRPPGTFSFISGAIFYLSAVAAFLLHAVISKLSYKNWFLMVTGLSLIVAVGVSGSRSAVLAVGLVVASLAVILVIRPNALNKFGRNLLLAAVVLWAVTQIPVFREGIGILSDRFTESAEAEKTSIVRGVVGRTLSGFTEPFEILDKVPFWGYGLGIGTNVGARFLIGRSAFLLTENEWSRILLESGTVLGMAFLIWRTSLAFRIGYLSLLQLKLGNTLPIFLFSAGFFALLNGSFGQPTSAGFAVVLNGLCLAAMNAGEPATEPVLEKKPPMARLPSRSAYAGRLHGADSDQTNGSLDR